ncbi:MAG: adenylate kinase [Actinomycetota bacterium]
MRKVAVVGSPGSGKSTLARQMAERLELRHVELDALHHQAGWTPRPVPDFRAAVATAIADDGWIVDGNYRPVEDLVHGKADTIVFLDLPRRQVTRRVLWRSARRGITREELWNGNRESLRNLVRRDPEVNIVAWTWHHQPKYRELYGGFIESGRWRHADVYRLRSSRDIASFLDALPVSRPT